MHQTLLDIKNRRSCRKYLERQVSDEALDLVLEAGTWAATGHGRQSPVMVVVQDKETVARLSKMNAAVLGTSSDPFYGAPTVIVVLADRSRPTWLQDGSLVMGNLMLAAHACGLASCWINRAREVFETEEGRALLKKWGIEGDYAGVGHCILGYADANGEAPAAPRKAGYIIRV